MTTQINSPLGKQTFGAQNSGRKILSVSDESDDFDTRPLPQSMLSDDRQPYQPQEPQQFRQQEPQDFRPKEVRLSPEQFNEMQAKRAELRGMQKKPTSEAKLRAEILCGIGRLHKEVTIGEGDSCYKFVIRSLKNSEMKDAMKTVSQVAIATEAIYELRNQILARCLYTIDGQPVDLVLGTNSLEDVLAFIGELQESVVSQLYNGYTSMVKEHDDKFNIKDGQQAQEVAEEIKKS